MGGLSLWHWLIVIVVVMLVFGKGRISDVMGDFAKGIKSFKKGMAEDDEVAEAKPQPRPIEHQVVTTAPSQASTVSHDSKAG